MSKASVLTASANGCMKCGRVDFMRSVLTLAGQGYCLVLMSAWLGSAPDRTQRGVGRSVLCAAGQTLRPVRS